MDLEINSKKKQKSEVYSGVDLFKLIAAVLVVMLHVVERYNFFTAELKYTITLFAVPFFFIASGFFFCRGLNNTNDKKSYFIRYQKQLLQIFLIWAIIIYSPFIISSYIWNNPDAGIINILLLLIRRIFIIGPGPFWYIVSLIFSITILYLLHNKPKLIVLCMVLGFILQIVYTCFRGFTAQFEIINLINKMVYVVYSWEFNFIMYGVPFCGIGYFICKKEFRLNIKISFAIFIVSTLLRVLEYNLPYIFSNNDFFTDNAITLAFIPQAVSYFMIAKELQVNISKECSFTLRKLSSFIYFLHMLLLNYILNPVLLEFLSDEVVYGVELIIPKVLIILFVCCGLFFIIKKINNKYLNKLLNS